LTFILGVFRFSGKSVRRSVQGGTMRRHEITDEQWYRIKDLLPGKQGDPGRTATDNRLFVSAVLWIARTGAPWRDLPDRFGGWNSVFQRFNRWCKRGVWRRLLEVWKDPGLECLMLDSTIIRAHQHAAGALKKGVMTRRWAGRVAGSARNCTWQSMRGVAPLK
jgi:putative transposase